MVPEIIPVTPPQAIPKKTAFLDAAIEKGVVFLLIFTPLAFGTVQQWSVSIMEMTAFFIFCLLLLKRDFATYRRGPSGLIFIFFALLIGLVIFQMIPLPAGLLKLISPSSLSAYKKFGNDAGSAFHSISLHPYATGQELLKFLAYAAVFFVVVNHYRTKQQLKSLAMTIVYMSLFLALFAVVQKMFWNGRIFWFYPVEEALLRSGAGIWGPYINRNHFAGYMEMAIPLGLGFLIYTAPAAKSLPGVSSGRKIARFLESDKILFFTMLFLLVLFISSSLLMTLSRGGITAFAVSSLVFALITHGRRSLRKKTVLLALFAAVILVVVVLASWERLEQRFDDLKRERDVNRLVVWKDSLSMVKDFPVFGTGLGTFENNYMRYQSKESRLLFDHAHNDYLEVLTDTGVIGLLAAGGLFCFFLSSVYKAWLRKRSMFSKCLGAGGLSSCIAIGLHSFTDFNLHIPANALLLAVISGMTYAVVFNVTGSRDSYEHNGTGDENLSSIPFPIPPLEVRGGGEAGGVTSSSRFTIHDSRFTIHVLLFLSLCLLYFPVRDLIADHYYREVSDILDDKTTEGLDVISISESTMPRYIEAIRSLKKAAALSPARSLYPKTLAELYSKLGIWANTMESLNAGLPPGAVSKKEAFDNAMTNMQKAVSLEPTNPDYHLALGQLYDTVYGDAARAEAELQKALEAFPINAPLRYSVAMHYLLTGRQGEALEQARFLARIDDSYIIPDDDPARKTFMIERRTRGYLSMLSNSYLFKALEIAWRISKDPHVIKGIAPDTADAKEVVQAFMEWKGIE